MKKILFLALSALVLNEFSWAHTPIKVFPNSPAQKNQVRQYRPVYNQYKQHRTTEPHISRYQATHLTTPNAQLLTKMNRSQLFNKNFMCHGPLKNRICTRINYFPSSH